MALTNQPYLPLYIQDWLSNSKLKQSSIGAHGLLINVMCLMHKEDTYGTLLLKQKYKQTEKPEKNFAIMLAKLLPFELADIETYLSELIEEKVLVIYIDNLICRRMVKDAEISTSRANNGSKGGLKTQDKFAKAKSKANADIEYEDETEIKKYNYKPKPSDFNGLPEVKVGSVIQLFKITKQVDVSNEDVKGLWEIFKDQNLTGKKFYQDEDAVYSHFLNWTKTQKIENGTGTNKGNSKLSPSAGRGVANRTY